MNWFWRVRIYNSDDHYWRCQIETKNDLREIACIQEFYWKLTGCKMVLEGMSEKANSELATAHGAFAGLWKKGT